MGDFGPALMDCTSSLLSKGHKTLIPGEGHECVVMRAVAALSCLDYILPLFGLGGGRGGGIEVPMLTSNVLTLNIKITLFNIVNATGNLSGNNLV